MSDPTPEPEPFDEDAPVPPTPVGPDFPLEAPEGM